MKVLCCCGMGRSGGTHQYQIASEVVERLGLGRGIGFGVGLWNGEFDKEEDWVVCKREPPDLKDRVDLAIGIYRDPRDVVCSFMRWRKEQGCYEDFDSALKETITAVEWFSEWEPNCKHIAQYETFNPIEEARAISLLFGMKLSDNSAKEIANLYSVERNIEAMEHIKEQDAWMNPSLMLTRAHIGPNKGKTVWRSMLTARQIEMIHDLLGDWMESRGYKCMQSG